jgi:sugar lactone lactonase YvrE
VLADQFEGRGLNIPNDLVYAIDGSMYFSDLCFRDPPPNPSHRLFRPLPNHTPQGKLRVASRDCQRPNGMALTALNRSYTSPIAAIARSGSTM